MPDEIQTTNRERMTAAIERRAAERGRHLTAQEQLENLTAALAENTPPEVTSFLARWTRVIKRTLCLYKHKWEFQHDAKPPELTCTRCGLTEPMPYGDQRMPYL